MCATDYASWSPEERKMPVRSFAQAPVAKPSTPPASTATPSGAPLPEPPATNEATNVKQLLDHFPEEKSEARRQAYYRRTA